MTDFRTTLASLSVIEFVDGVRGGSQAAHDDWLAGPSLAAVRVRERIAATATEGFTAAVVCGPPGSGRVCAARMLHAGSRRGKLAAAVLDASDPRCPQRLTALARRIGQDHRAVGNIILRWADDAPVDTIAAIADLLTAQGSELRCGAILLTSESVATLRSLSLQHSQLLARCDGAIIGVPPLSERRPDIEGLVKRFVAHAARQFGRKVRGVSPEVLAALSRRAWPGNVRQLAGLLDQAVLGATTDWLTVDDFPGLAAEGAPPVRRGEMVVRMPGSSLREIELQALRLALELTDGRIVRASELLGITRHALRRKLEKHGLSDLRRSPGGAPHGSNDDGDAFI